MKVRADLGLDARAPLCPWAYAEHLGVVILTFDKLGLPEKVRDQLLVHDPRSWSGLTLKEGGRFFIVLNPTESRPRQVSTLMHENSHIVLSHVPGRVDVTASGMMLLSDYPKDQEDEADWLAATLLLPRDALHHYRSLGWDRDAICNEFGVSSDLCDWRLRMTGVETQLRHRGRA